MRMQTWNSKQHTAHCTRLCRSNRPSCRRRTSGTDAACAYSRVCVGARRLQHPASTSRSAQWPSKGPQHLLCPLSCRLPVTGDQQHALSSLPSAQHAHAPARARASAARTAPAAAPARRPDSEAAFHGGHVPFTGSRPIVGFPRWCEQLQMHVCMVMTHHPVTSDLMRS